MEGKLCEQCLRVQAVSIFFRFVSFFFSFFFFAIYLMSNMHGL